MLRRLLTSLIGALILAFAAASVAGLPAGSTAHAGGDCVDTTPGAGTELEFIGVGTTNHYAIVEGDVCPGATEMWTISTLDVAIPQYIGIKVVEDDDISIDVLTPDGSHVALGPGEEYRDDQNMHPVSYQITIRGEGDGLAGYRLDGCRSIGPCQFGAIGLSPGNLSPPNYPGCYLTDDGLPQSPDDLSPPDQLSPAGALSPPEEPTPPDSMSPPLIACPAGGYSGAVSLPSTGFGGGGLDVWLLRSLFLAVGAAFLLAIAAMMYQGSREQRRNDGDV